MNPLTHLSPPDFDPTALVGPQPLLGSMALAGSWKARAAVSRDSASLLLAQGVCGAGRPEHLGGGVALKRVKRGWVTCSKGLAQDPGSGSAVGALHPTGDPGGTPGSKLPPGLDVGSTWGVNQ